MATVQASPALAGKTVNLPHSEFATDNPKNTVTFGEDGKAKVQDTVADALVEFYGSQVRRVR